MDLEQYAQENRSAAGSYALAGFALAFLTLFPFTFLLAGPAVGVPMGLYESFLFALSSACVFGVVSGAVAGVSEPAREKPARAAQAVAQLPRVEAQAQSEAA
jgi:hypothetical protein